MVRWWIQILAVSLALFSVSCTREVPEKMSLSLAVPPTFSSMTTTLQLGFVAINMRPGGTGAPSVYKVDFKDMGFVPQGGSLSLTIPGHLVPRHPDLLVQYFGVFESETAGMVFTYGSTRVNSDINGAIYGNITASTFGSATQRANVMGRYDFGTTPPYKTGRILMEFTQTGADPPVEIESSEMINGWFNIMAVNDSESEVIRHSFFEDGSSTPVSLFGGDTSVTQMDTTYFTPPTANVLRIDVPVRSRKEFSGFNGSGYSQRVSPPEKVYVGFFNGAGCTYYPATTMYIPGLYQTDLITPLKYDSGGTQGTDIVREIGGQTTPCGGTANDTDIAINPRWLADEGGAEPHGIAAPFQALGNYDEYPKYARAFVVDNSASPRIKLQWDYLDTLDVDDTGLDDLDGATVYVKYAPNGGGGHHGDFDQGCNLTLQNSGYASLTVLSGAIESVDVDQDAAGSGFSYNYMDPNYFRNYQFAICPYRTINGVNTYYSRYAEAFDVGEITEVNPFSFGEGTEADPAPTGPVLYNGWKGRISTVTPTLGSTSVTIGGGVSGIDVGDEVAFIVTAMGSAGDCGYHYNNTGDSNFEVKVGDYHLARVHAAPGNISPITIRSGSFVDYLDVPTYLNAAATAANFCFVQAVQVKHYPNITFGTAGDRITAPPLNMANDAGGGFILARVADTITFSAAPSTAWFDASGAGFAGGGIGIQGAGISGDNGATESTSGGSHDGTNDSGGGGGGYVDGGDGGNPSVSNRGLGVGTSIAQNGYELYLGGGGGGSSDMTGGNGGGSIMISARNIYYNNVSGTLALAKGAMGSGSTAGGGGGGGAGSINILSERLTYSPSAPNVTIEASGGDGGSTSGINGGGGGGAGSIRTWMCNFWNNAGAPPVSFSYVGNGGAGGTGSTNNGAAGTNSTASVLINYTHPGCIP